MITKKDIEVFEVETGIHLPDMYTEFLLKNNSSIYCNKVFSIIHSDGYETNDAIVKFHSLEELAKGIEYNEYMVDFQTHFDLLVEYVEANNLINIAETLGGTIAISIDGQHKGKIYSIDNGDFGIIFLANDILNFFSLLRNE